jgi:hypothetical protein
MDDNEIKNSIKIEEKENEEINKINLDDYKDIYENQKLQTKLNFFENSVDDSKIGKKSQKNFLNNNIVNSFKKDERNNKNNLQNLETLNINSNFKSNPHFRKPRDISDNNIDKLNSVYDKYKMKIGNKNDGTNNISNKIEKNYNKNIFQKEKNYFEKELNKGKKKSLSRNDLEISNEDIGFIKNNDNEIEKYEIDESFSNINFKKIHKAKETFNKNSNSDLIDSKKEENDDFYDDEKSQISNLLGKNKYLFIFRC